MDHFLNDGYDLSYNTNTRFPHSDRTYLNHGHASEVSLNMLHVQLTLTCSPVNFKLSIIRYHICFS